MNVLCRQLEFEYLSLITGDMRFADMINFVTSTVLSKKPDDGALLDVDSIPFLGEMY